MSIGDDKDAIFLFDAAAVTLNRHFLDGIDDVHTFILQRQILEGAGPVIGRAQGERLLGNLFTASQQFHGHACRTLVVLIVAVVPFLLNRNARGRGLRDGIGIGKVDNGTLIARVQSHRSCRLNLTIYGRFQSIAINVRIDLFDFVGTILQRRHNYASGLSIIIRSDGARHRYHVVGFRSIFAQFDNLKIIRRFLSQIQAFNYLTDRNNTMVAFTLAKTQINTRALNYLAVKPTFIITIQAIAGIGRIPVTAGH